MNAQFLPVRLPYTNGAPPGTIDPVTGQKFVGRDGVTYDFYMRSGDYTMSSNTTLFGKMYINGDVRLVVPSSCRVSMTGQDTIFITTNSIPGQKPGSLRLYVDCPTASIGGNAIQNPNSVTNFYYFGTTNNTTLTYGGNAMFSGCIYAPQANLTIGGGGSTAIDFVGALVAANLRFNTNFNFHFDEALLRVWPQR